MELHPSKGPIKGFRDPSKTSQDASSEVNRIHSQSDLDRSARAQHHTLGFRPNQASPGNHVHDGGTSKKIAAGLGLVLTGSRGGNVALLNLINMLKPYVEFTDNTT